MLGKLEVGAVLDTGSVEDWKETVAEVQWTVQALIDSL